MICHALNVLSGGKKSAPVARQGAQVKRVLECIDDRVSRWLSLFPRFLFPFWMFGMMVLD